MTSVFLFVAALLSFQVGATEIPCQSLVQKLSLSRDLNGSPPEIREISTKMSQGDLRKAEEFWNSPEIVSAQNEVRRLLWIEAPPAGPVAYHARIEMLEKQVRDAYLKKLGGSLDAQSHVFLAAVQKYRFQGQPLPKDGKLYTVYGDQYRPLTETTSAYHDPKNKVIYLPILNPRRRDKDRFLTLPINTKTCAPSKDFVKLCKNLKAEDLRPFVYTHEPLTPDHFAKYKNLCLSAGGSPVLFDSQSNKMVAASSAEEANKLLSPDWSMALACKCEKRIVFGAHLNNALLIDFGRTCLDQPSQLGQDLNKELMASLSLESSGPNESNETVDPTSLSHACNFFGFKPGDQKDPRKAVK